MKFVVSAVLALLVSFAAVGQDSTVYTQTRNVVYQEAHGVALVMDIFQPTGNANGLAVVDVVSGAWHSDRGKINDHIKAGIYDALCGRGFVVFGVRPGSVTKFTSEEMVRNVKTGIKWVKEHAAEYRINPDQLGLTGASAGGHLASLTALTASDEEQVQAVGIFFPPTNFLKWGDGPGPLRRVSNLFFLGGGKGKTDEELAEAAKKVSPITHVKESAPPFFIYHGDADEMVPLQQSQDFVAALKAAGNSAELVVKPDGGHPWPTISEESAELAKWFETQLAGK